MAWERTLGFTLQQDANFLCILIHSNTPCSLFKLGQQLDFYVFIFECVLYLPEYKVNFFPYTGICKMVDYLTVMKKWKYVCVTKRKLDVLVLLALLSVAQWGHNLFHMFVCVVGFIM